MGRAFQNNATLGCFQMIEISEGARLRDEGIRIAEAHAASVAPDWPELAWFYLTAATDWGNLSRFQTTDFRKWAEARGLPKPPDARAYGGVMRRGIKAGKIRADGYAPTPDPQAHCRPAVVWRVVGSDAPKCPHGARAEDCEACYVAADFAYDAARENRVFGRSR